MNDAVAKSLRAAGFEVYVPHEQAPNNLTAEDIAEGRYDKETIFRLDFAAMQQSDACVVVGRTGRDCAWELGWFAKAEVPVFFVPAGDLTWNTCPMLIPTFNSFPHIESPEAAGFMVSKWLALWEAA